nr:MAG TPA: Protein of unknown function (DUF1684) [Caudoviricetes sp.]
MPHSYHLPTFNPPCAGSFFCLCDRININIKR